MPRVYPLTTLNYLLHIGIWDSTKFMVKLPTLSSIVHSLYCAVRSVQHPGNNCLINLGPVLSPALANPFYSCANASCILLVPTFITEW